MKFAKKIDDNWTTQDVFGTGPVAEAQAAVLAAQGWMPVREAERPADSAFLIWSDDYAEEGGGVTQSWWSAPRVIRLDREKLIGAAAAGGWLNAAIAYFEADQAAQDWWANNMTYVEGSPMAQAAMAALGLTLEQAHALVLQCKE